jgi:hypothetical protein
MGNTPLAPLNEPFYVHHKADGSAVTDGRAVGASASDGSNGAESESASASAESPAG